MTPEPLALFTVPRTRNTDELFEAITAACGINWRQLTPLGRGPLNRACKELRSVDATPSQVAARAKEFGRKFPGATLTACALAKHWASLDVPVARREFTKHVPLVGTPMPESLRKRRR